MVRDGHRARLLESMSDGYYAFDREWRLTDVNPQAEKVLGLRRKRSLGRLFHEVFPSTTAGWRSGCPSGSTRTTRRWTRGRA